MAVIDIQGFDKFGPAGIAGAELQALLQQEFTTAASSANLSLAAGLSATGEALKLTSGINPYLAKTYGASYTTLYGGFRFQYSLGVAFGIGFKSGATEGLDIWINSTGNVVVGKAGIAGTALATSTQTVTANSTHYLEWAITFSTSGAGSCTIYLDGVATSIALTSQSFGAASANNIYWGLSAGTAVLDDFYLFDNTGGTNNAALLTNPRVETELPSTDSAVQFTIVAAVIGLAYSFDQASTNAPGAAELVLLPVTPSINCTVNSIGILPGATSATAKFKGVIYSDTAGAPHTLLSSGTEVVGCTSGTALALALTTPQALTAGTQYWIGYITDTSVALFECDTSLRGEKAANTYASGAPGTAPAMTTGQPSWSIWGNVSGTGVNWYETAENPNVGLLSYNQSSTVGQEDLFGRPALSSTPTTIYTVKAFVCGEKSDAGARTISIRMKSGATDSGGSSTGQTPPTSFAHLSSFFDTDPATGVAWTASGLNAAKSGYKIDS